ncbi:conjugative transposon protein TraM [Mucilaginibacter ximonensis]|uniref:Conjugative transposon protein TraM n=1 Tax=Mucilaginibacter ximonensis TaxID=538021 RepID=A0ABW5Y9L9_9SPHI
MKTIISLSPQQQRQRKFLLGLPVLIIPFLTLLFWSLGGGKGNQAQAETPKGFNSQLPQAVLPGKNDLNKLSYYAQAKVDSQKRQQALQSDPYAKRAADSAGKSAALGGPNHFAGNKLNGFSGDPGAGEAKIYQQLAALQTAMNKPASAPVQTTTAVKPVTISKQTEDPELKQMNGLLEKVLDIQHPERMAAKQPTNTSPDRQFAAIPAVVEGNQKVVTGTVVKLKLLDSAVINGQTIPKGTLLYGAGNLYNQRLTIIIKNIGLGNTILPVDLTVFDKNDALEGISVPEAVTGDGLKEGADQGVQSMELMSLDGSLSAQAATAGLNTAKGLFSKKIKRVKGKIKDGHLVLLRDNKKK